MRVPDRHRPGEPDDRSGDRQGAGGTAGPAVLVVDAMNVIGSRPDGWWRDRDRALARLVERLREVRPAPRVVVVADGRPVPSVPPGPDRGVEVLWAGRPGPDAADDRIVELVRSLGPGTTVVTSDEGLIRRVRALGADTVGAGTFRSVLDT